MTDDGTRRAEERMSKSLEALKAEMVGIRTGKASAALLDPVRVDAWGSMLPLTQVASITAPQPRLLVVQPWQKNMLSQIVKAIQKADLGLNPAEDGELIRIPIPSLTEERRLDLVKRVKKLGEEAKVGLRNIRRDANEELKKLEKDHTLSEDESHRLQAKVQKLTDRFVGLVDDVLAKKEKEVLEV